MPMFRGDEKRPPCRADRFHGLSQSGRRNRCILRAGFDERDGREFAFKGSPCWQGKSRWRSLPSAYMRWGGGLSFHVQVLFERKHVLDIGFYASVYRFERRLTEVASKAELLIGVLQFTSEAQESVKVFENSAACLQRCHDFRFIELNHL